MNFIHQAKLEIERNEYVNEAAAHAANIFYYQASGSVNKGYHVEFNFDTYDTASEFAEVLAENDMFPKIMGRDNRHTVYLKSGECICNLLLLVGAKNTLMDLHNEIALRSVRNDANRRANCDSANIEKQVGVANAQVEKIRELMQSGEFETLNEKLKRTLLARLEHPDASYIELAEILGITKSGLVNRLRIIGD